MFDRSTWIVPISFLSKFFSCCYLNTRELLYGLKIAWISVASVVAGLLLFYTATQAQDLFFDAPDGIWSTIQFWLTFYTLTVVAWVVPVHASSAWILSQFRPRVTANANVFPVKRWARQVIPRYLVASCFLAAFIGQILALANAASVDGLDASSELGAIIDNVGTGLVILAAYFIIAGQITWLLLWRPITNISDARLRRFLKAIWCCVAIPIAPPALFFLQVISAFRVTIAIAVTTCALTTFWLYFRHRGTTAVNRWSIVRAIVWWTTVAIVVTPLFVTSVFILVTIALSQAANKLGLLQSAILPIITLLLATFVWQVLALRSENSIRQLAVTIERIAIRWLKPLQPSIDRSTLDLVYLVIVIASLVIMFILFFIDPAVSSAYVPRGLIVPIALGLYVPILTLLSYWSLRYRTSIVIGIVASIVLADSFLRDPHDIRTTDPTSNRSSIDQSIKRWAEVNNCKLGTSPASLDACPSPIIIAAAGGASRAAFLTAGLIGELLDEKSTKISPFPGKIDPPSFSPDSSRLVTLSGEVVARLWDTGSGRQISELNGHKDLVSSAKFSPSGNLIVTSSYDKTARLWDGKTGAPIAVLRGHTYALKTALFNATETRVLTLSGLDVARIPDDARLWDASTGNEIARLRLGEEKVSSAAFSPLGNRIVTTAEDAYDPVARLWDAHTGALLQTLAHGDHYESIGVHFSPITNKLVTVEGPSVNFQSSYNNESNVARLWDLDRGKQIAELKDVISIGAFSPDGRRVLAYLRDKQQVNVVLLDASTGNAISTLTQPGRETFDGIFNQSGDRILTLSQVNSLSTQVAVLWDGRTGLPLTIIREHDGDWVRQAIFDNAGGRVITLSGNSAAHAWSSETGKRIEAFEFQLEKTNRETQLQFTGPDDRIVVSAGSANDTFVEDTNIQIRNGKNGELIRAFKLKYDYLGDVQISPSGRLLATISGKSFGDRRRIAWDSDSSAQLWNNSDGSQIPIDERPRIVVRSNRRFEKQLFAISAVSGGALGAVVAYAAMADGQTKGATDRGPTPPCRKDFRAYESDWFAPYIKETPSAAPHESWRSCLELLVAGDFLSPIIMDMIGDPFQVSPRGDRAAVLELAWERRYDRLTANDGSGTLSKGFVDLRERVLQANSSNWLPILILNGTSVSTGRRIVVSDVAPFRKKQEGKSDRLFVDAYDFDELFDPKYTGTDVRDRSVISRDIRLSTAATMSARFPIISPHGNVRTEDGKVIDRVVDGGYFEYFGASTALELSRELKSYGLTPMTVLINNAPEVPPMDCVSEDTKRKDMLPPFEVKQTTLFSSVASPLDALIGASGARGTYAAVQLCREAGVEQFALISVSDEGLHYQKDVSMSWWLSKRTQKYIDGQVASRPYLNRLAWEKIIAAR